MLEYETLEEADDERIELMRGRAVREPTPGGVHGVVWIIDPRARSLTVHATAFPPRVVHAGEVLEAGDIIDGFRVSVGDLFAGL